MRSAPATTSTSSKSNWERNLTTYIVVGGAMLTAASDVQADPVYSGIQNVAVGLDSFFDLDLDGNGSTDFRFENDTSSDFGGPYRTLTPVSLGNAAVGAVFFASVLGPGVALPGSENFETASLKMARVNQDGTTSGSWIGVSNGYLGVAFDIAGLTHYGWVRASVSGSTDFNNSLTATIHDWAYEDVAGASIKTGQTAAVPEPGSLALLALGASGLAAYRRRRNLRATRDTGANTSA